jgi:4-amino-4-deoxy-L-arabinose transferase-like glycosyltransferase
MLESSSATVVSTDSMVGERWFVMTEFAVFMLLAVVTLAIRLPYFFPAVLAWDESTQILMGQSLLDGHLPYVMQWDLKPPLAFAFFSGAIAIFGKDIVGIRLAGALCVVAIACLLYLTSRRMWDRQSGIIAALLSIAAISLGDFFRGPGLLSSGQATMTEHVALVPLMGALYLLIARKESNVLVFFVGVLMAVATLVRTNLAYAAMAVAIYLAATAIRQPRAALQRVAAYSAGGLLIVVLTWLPYALSGQHDVWWSSVIVAPLKYSQSQYSLLGSMVVLGLHAIGIYGDGAGYRVEIHWFNLFVWLTALGGVVVVVRRWRDYSESAKRDAIVLIGLATATAFSILKSGAAYEHYLIQLEPFAAILAAAWIAALQGKMKAVALAGAAVLMVVSARPVLVEYKAMRHRWLAHQDLRYGPAYQIAAYLQRENPRHRPVYLLTDHVANWLTNSVPPTKLTHPSNISFPPYLLDIALGSHVTAEDELNNVFRQAPEVVVVADHMRFLQGETKALFDGLLAKRYFLATEIEGRKIYRLKPDLPGIP